LEAEVMRPRWHKVFSDLTSHLIRSLLVTASIAVGLFAIGMITTTHLILSEDIRSGYQAINPANIQMRASTFDEKFVQHIRRMPQVAGAEGVWDTRLQVWTVEGYWKPISIKAQDFNDGAKEMINQVTLIEGSWPPGNKQIALDINKIADTGAGLGDEVEIKLPSGIIRRLPVVAIVQDQTIGSSGGEGGFFLANIQGYVTRDTLPWLEQLYGFNTLYATVDQAQEDREAIRAVADILIDEFHQNGYLTNGSVVRLSSEHPNVSYIDAMAAVMFLLGFLVVFLSGFLITNTLSALLNQQVQQIGVMKTLGASRRQIISLYMVLILVFSLIALAIAVPLSNQASYLLLQYLSERINFQLEAFQPVPTAIMLQVIIAVLVPQVAGSLPILQGTRISVREALSGTSPVQLENHGFLYRQLAKIRGVSRPVLISLRNTLRKRLRLVLTLITLTLGGATFIATLNVRNSIETYVDRLGHYFLADVNLALNQPYRVERVRRDVEQVPGVKEVEGWSVTLANVVMEDGKTGETLQLVAPPAESELIEPILLEGRWLHPDDYNAITLNELFLETIPAIKVGDTLRLKIGLRETDWVVVGFFQFAGRSSGLFAYVNFETLAQETSMIGRAVSYRIVADGKSLNLEEQEELARRIDIQLTERGYKINNVSAGRSLQEMTSEGLNILTTFLLIMSFLLASVGSIGLMGTMSLNVMERTREIGVMRAIGGSNRAIITIVLLEGVLIGLLSWMLSCLVALPLSKQLADVMFQIIFDRDAALAFTFLGNLIWLGLVMLLSVLASVVPAYNASKLTIREVLAYE
jgi:putative ABC transport system permease protein